MQGSFMGPMKFTRKWDWENTWLAFCFLGFILLPLMLALVTVPELGRVVASAAPHALLLAGVFGLGWGCGSMCFGLTVRVLGIGLAYAIILGLSSALGSLIPWLTSSERALGYSVLLCSGVLLMLVGVVVCSVAG